MQSTNLVDVNSLIDEQPSKKVDVNSLIEQPQKKNSLPPSQPSSVASIQSASPSVPPSGLVESNPPVKPLLNTQQAAEKFGLTPIQNLQNQNVAKSDNTLSVPNAGVFNRQVNAFNEVTDKTITDNAPDESVVIRNEYNKKRKGILNPQVVIPASQLTPENNFGLNANLYTPQVADNAVNKIQVKPVQGAPVNAVAPPTPEQEFKQKVSDNLSSLEKETIAKSGEYAMKVTSDPVAAGFITKAILGDNMAISQKRQIDKGYTVPQADLYQTGQVGITSMIAALDKKYESDPQNADYIAQKTDLEKQAANLIDKFPEYKVSQLTKAVAIELGKLHPEVSNSPSMARLYLPEIKKEMGLSDEDIKAIDFDNYPTSNFLTSTIAPIYKGALGLGLSATRAIGSALGVDKDLLNSRLTEAVQSPTFFDDIETMQNTGQTVDVNKASPTFLQNIADPNKGKYNYNFHTISNAIGNGVGQLAWFVYGTKGAGAAANKALGAVAGAAAGDGAISLNGFPVKLSADATNEVGMAGLMMGQGYEDYYQKARTVISDKPEDEWKRHTFSLINGALDYLGFRVLGNVVKGLPPAAEKEIGQVLKDAPNLAAVNKKALQSKLTDILKGAGEAAKETAFVGSATTASEIAKAVVVNVMGNDEAAKEENAQLPSVIEGSIASLPFSMFIPILGSKIIAGGQSKVHKENIYNAGISPENYKGDAHKLFDMGAINQEQLNDRIQVINTADKVVKSIPSDVFDKLNHNQRVTYVNSKIRELALKAKAEGVQDEALTAYYADQIKGEVAKRSDVLNGGGKEGEFPESVSVIKPKTQEEINNQIPTVTIAPKENTPETKQGVSVVLPQTVERGRAIPTVTVGGKTNENATEKTAEVPKPTEAANTTNETANKVEQSTVKEQVAPFIEEIKQPIYKNVFQNGNEADINAALKEVAQQANGSEGEKKGAISSFGENIVKIAQEKFPNDKVAPTKGITDFENSLKQKESVDVAQKLNPKSETKDNIPSTVEDNPALKDVESTAKAIKDVSNNNPTVTEQLESNKKYNNAGGNDFNRLAQEMYVKKRGLTNEQLFNEKERPKELQTQEGRVKFQKDFSKWTEDNKPEIISELYHQAKKDGSNPELVKAVEDLLKPKNESNPTTPSTVNKPISVNEGIENKQTPIVDKGVDKVSKKDFAIRFRNDIELGGDARKEFFKKKGITNPQDIPESERDNLDKEFHQFLEQHKKDNSKLVSDRKIENKKKFNALSIEHQQEIFNEYRKSNASSDYAIDNLVADGLLNYESKKNGAAYGKVKGAEMSSSLIPVHVKWNFGELNGEFDTSYPNLRHSREEYIGRGIYNRIKDLYERNKTENINNTSSTVEEKPISKPISEVNKKERSDIEVEQMFAERWKKEAKDAKDYLKKYQDNPFADKVQYNKKVLANANKQLKIHQAKLEELRNPKQAKEEVGFDIKLKRDGVIKEGKVSKETDKAVAIDYKDGTTEILKKDTFEKAKLDAEKSSKPTNTKESNFSKKLKDKYKDFNLGGTKSAEKTTTQSEGEIKTDNGKQPIEQYVSRAKEVLNKLFPDATFETYKTTDEYVKAGGAEGSRGMFDSKADGTKRLLLNLEQMKEDGIGKTAFHEAIHPIVDEVVGAHPEELNPLWNDLYREMQGVKGFEKVVEHVDLYKQNERPAAEGLTELLTQIAEGNISLNDVPPARKGIIVDLLNKLFEKLGLNIRFGESYDFKDFATDIKKAFDTGDVEALKNVVDKRAEANKRATDNAGKVNGLLFGKSADKGRFEAAASKIADSIRNADIPQWIINTSSEAKQSGFGLSGENMKEALAKSIEAVGKIMDKGVDLKEAITREVDNFIKNIKSLDGIKDLKPNFEKTLRDNFEKEALNQFSKEQSDRVATVENMVKDAMDEGFDNLNDIQEAITNGLGIDTPAFRKMIDDAYEKVKGGDVGKEPPEGGLGVNNNSDSFSEWSRVNLGSLSKIKDQFRKIGISWDNRAESAMRNLQKRGRKGERLFDTALREMDNFHKSLSRGKTPRFNTDDQVAMHFLKIGTEQQIAKLKDNISEDYTDINSIGSDVLIDQYDRVNAVLGAMRSESGVGLAYGTVEARLSPDYGLKVRQMQMIRANDGEPLSEAQENLVKETWQKEKDLMKREQEYRINKMQEDFDKQLSDLKDGYEKEIQDLKNGKKATQKITKSRVKLSDNLLDIAKRIRESNEFDNYLKNKGNDTKAAGVTFDFKEGAAQAIEYVAKAVKAGEKVTDAISKAVDKYKGDLDNKGVSDFKEKLSGLITKASLPNTEDVISKIKDIADNEKTTQITKGMVGKNLIRDLVDSHIADTKKEDILAEATKKIQTVLPDVTKENITEAYLRQGDFKMDKKNKLEDIVKKDKLALKRIAKDELTANQKQKIKLGQEKDKTQRRIAELEDKLKNGEYDEEGQQMPLKLNRPDAELINFNREKNKLESVYRKEQEKIREKNRHIGFRIAETARALWVTILIGHPKTLAKIGWMMVLRPTSEAVSKLTFGKAFDLISPEISSAAKGGGESNSIASITKMSAAFFRQMGADKLQKIYENGERRYYDAFAKYEEYKNSDNPNEKQLQRLKRDMDNKMLSSLGNTIYQFIGGSSLKDAFSTLLHRANIIEKQFGKVSEEQMKGEDVLGKTKYILGFIGRSHSALKTLSGRASFAAGFMARVEAQLAKGEHPNADKLIELAHESYIDWERGKYQQSNYISDKWNQMINNIDNRLHDRNKSWEGYNKATQLLARTDVAITRVPVNIIHEAVAEYLTGAFRAPILAKRAYNEANKQAIKEGYTKGLEVNDAIERGTTREQFKDRVKEIVSEMDEDKAATIVRLFRKGGIGMGLYAAALLWGGVHFGIFQHRGQKKVKEEEDLGADELNPGQVMFGDTKYGEVVSGMIEHTPALWPTFMGLGLAKMYRDDINNGKTTSSAAGDAIITHLKIIEGNIPQTKFIDPVEIGQTIYRNVEKKTKSISDTWGLTDNAEVRGGLPKSSKARQYLDEHNLEILVPEKYQVKVGIDKRHPYGRMTDEEYNKFKKLRSSLLNDRLAPLFENSEGAPREKLKAEIRSISANATKQAKNRMIVEGDISRVKSDY